MDNSREVWEGWTAQDFINDLELAFKFQVFTSKEEVIKWCKSEQPYYKKRIPEVEAHFIAKAGV